MPVIPGMTSPCSRTPPVLLLPLAVTLGTELRSLSCLSGSHAPTRWNKSTSRAPLSDVSPLLSFKPFFTDCSAPGGNLVGLGIMGSIVTGAQHRHVPLCPRLLPAIQASLVHSTSTLGRSRAATQTLVQGPSEGDGSWGGRCKGRGENLVGEGARWPEQE